MAYSKALSGNSKNRHFSNGKPGEEAKARKEGGDEVGGNGAGGGEAGVEAGVEEGEATALLSAASQSGVAISVEQCRALG